MKKASKIKTSTKRKTKKSTNQALILSPVELLCLEYKFKNNL